MKRNIGKSDKMIRVIIAIILATLDWFKIIESEYSWALSALAIVLLISTFTGFCPLYTLFGINTCKNEV